MNYEQETEKLYTYGFHLAYDPEDAAEYPQDANPKGEVWQLGSGKRGSREPLFLSREQALAYIALMFDD